MEPCSHEAAAAGRREPIGNMRGEVGGGQARSLAEQLAAVGGDGRREDTLELEDPDAPLWAR